ncbi:MAG: helix-turn-helix domain-containing protein [Defluviitaleaceae bacterium]|nr:helix-turn-helix domain-containing protein [Defluviitaleaceae bacterium]MCL2263895.1 helix-turn-helix domain-containing protein [Defluviitaleaceae bacterium]
MRKERNKVPFTSFGVDLKQARKALGYTQKAFAEEIGIDPRYLANIENSGSLPSLPIFYEIIHLCKLPVERYFFPDIETKRESPERERTTLKLNVCPEKYISIIEGAIDAAIKLDGAGKA